MPRAVSTWGPRIPPAIGAYHIHILVVQFQTSILIINYLSIFKTKNIILNFYFEGHDYCAKRKFVMTGLKL